MYVNHKWNFKFEKRKGKKKKKRLIHMLKNIHKMKNTLIFLY